MRKIDATLKGIPLTLHLAESKDETTAGYHSVPIRQGEGMLFRFTRPCWIPVEVDGLDGKLDAVFLINGAVNHILQRMKDQGANYAGFGDALLELPAGFVERNGVVLSDRLEVAGMVFTEEQKSDSVDVAMAKREQVIDLTEKVVTVAPKPEPKVESGKRKK